MNVPIIADTSVWVNFFNGVENHQVNVLTKYLENDDPIYLCLTILREVPQGIKSDKHYREVKDCLLTCEILKDDGIEMAISSVALYRTLRKKGIAIRKSNDCLIAQYAIKHALKILHHDRDFDLIMKNHK